LICLKIQPGNIPPQLGRHQKKGFYGTVRNVTKISLHG
jgi:hypothetical protein